MRSRRHRHGSCPEADLPSGEADQIGLTIFGGSGTGTLRLKDDDICPAHDSNATHAGRLVPADISEGSWDGGDGGFAEDENGLNRGE